MKLMSLLLLLLCVSRAEPAHGQMNTLAVNLKTAKLTWGWVPGTGGVAEYFQVRCLHAGIPGPVLGPKTTATAREQLIVDIVKVPGDYTCTVRAGNTFGESGPSNDVVFRAGDVPLAATTLNVSGGTP